MPKASACISRCSKGEEEETYPDTAVRSKVLFNLAKEDVADITSSALLIRVVLTFSKATHDATLISGHT